MQAYDAVYGTLVSGSWPNVLALNASGPTATDGTPYTAEFIQDIWGAREDLMVAAGLTPNGITEGVGSSQFLQAFRRGAGLPPGIVMSVAMNESRLAVCRLLKMERQIIDISAASPYYDLGAAVYVGDAQNNNAALDGYYKCDVNGTRTTSGAYMVIPDARGMFPRGAGQNSKHNMANGSPYDGGAIGAFIGDAIRNITGRIYASIATANASSTPLEGAFTYHSWARNIASLTGTTWMSLEQLVFDASIVVPTDSENRPASLSALVCVTY
jgi:hypothetical protein